MKKSIYISIFAIILSIFALFSNNSYNQTSAAYIPENQMRLDMTAIIIDISKFDERIAGSEDEKSVSEYIQNYLNEQTQANPAENQSTTNGIQKFNFQSRFDGGYYSSQNIVYTIPAKVETTKKVIICCSYDGVSYKQDAYGNLELNASEGINQSAGSVALLLALAKYLPSKTYDFNIEFVFFGAGSSNNAGSKFYTQGISEDDAKEILLAINFDTIALGNHLYFYVDEVETKISEFANNLFRDESLYVQQISLVNLGKTLVQDNGLGLNYTHIAQTSNNLNFMKAKVLTMNFFAGDYDSGINVGRCEYYGKDTITYTNNDSLEYIVTNYGFDSVTDNLLEVYNSVQTLISSDLFIETCSASFGQTGTFYSIFGNKKLVVILTAIMLMIFIIVSLIIHYKLTVKSYNTNIEDDFVSAVINMAGNVDTKASGGVAKNISEVIADDIKKDKRIRKK